MRQNGASQHKGLRKNDDAVSPVIGTILMVAVTVMLSAGVYVWTTVFNDDDQAPENLSLRPAGMDRDGNGLVDWVRVTLVSGNDAPYNLGVVGLQLIPPSGPMLDATNALCADPSASAASLCTSAATGTWDVGDSLFIPCQADGKHIVTIKVRGHTVLDDTVACNEAA